LVSWWWYLLLAGAGAVGAGAVRAAVQRDDVGVVDEAVDGRGGHDVVAEGFSSQNRGSHMLLTAGVIFDLRLCGSGVSS
jgi:hypothetical protein